LIAPAGGGAAPRGASIDAVLFDLGGVLVELDFDRAFSHWAACAGCAPEDLRSRFSMDEAYERHEVGALGLPGYFASLRASLAIDIPDEAFEAGWNSIFVREVPGILDLLHRLRGVRPLYLFSNTNPTHFAYIRRRFAGLFAHFDALYASPALGKRKPHPAAFHAVAQAIDVPPERILFFDDTAVNVEGALSVGMHAVHVKALGDIEAVLREFALLP
jgi:putative hydrolase of the HAD superfamily